MVQNTRDVIIKRSTLPRVLINEGTVPKQNGESKFLIGLNSDQSLFP